jgi:hypothetical protein
VGDAQFVAGRAGLMPLATTLSAAVVMALARPRGRRPRKTGVESIPVDRMRLWLIGMNRSFFLQFGYSAPGYGQVTCMTGALFGWRSARIPIASERR